MAEAAQSAFGIVTPEAGSVPEEVENASPTTNASSEASTAAEEVEVVDAEKKEEPAQAADAAGKVEAVAEEKKAAKKKEAVPMDCRNCGKAGAKLKCSKCKKVAYCKRDCQISDWSFHKRICSKPKEKEDAKKKSPEKKKAPEKKKKKKEDVSTIDEEDEKEILKDLKGYCHFRRTLSDEDNKLLGSFTPQKVTAPAAAAATTASPGSSDNVMSAWNAKGTTFEEQDKSAWAKARLEALMTGLTAMRMPPVEAMAASGAPAMTCLVEVTEVKDVEGEATIVLSRGKRRHGYDFSLKLMWKATVSNLAAVDAPAKVVKGSLKVSDIMDDANSPAVFEESFKCTVAERATIVRQAVVGAASDSSDESGLSASLKSAVLQKIVGFDAEYRGQ